VPERDLDVHVLDSQELESFFERYRHDTVTLDSMDAQSFLREVLQRANAFVPSEAGSVLFDRPFERTRMERASLLYFVAAFGPSADSLLGAPIAVEEGVVGHVYRTGTAHRVEDPASDPYFCQRFDESHDFQTSSLLAVPIRIENRICGVLELVNRNEGDRFDERDQALLEIFAAYTSVSIQNLLDAKRASEAARSDDLTGLANDRFFHRRLAQDLDHADASGGRLALLFMDLDNFKSVNDSHGHLAGSQVLKEVGYLLRRVVRSPAATLARYGGDEFVIILPGYGVERARDVAERIRTAIRGERFLRGTFSWASGPITFDEPLTCSIGIAGYPDNVPRSGSSEHRRNELLRLSDQAMYSAKGRSKDAVVVA
jgi:diguanylate cyclase (GGDEF)-like protein